MSCAEKYTSLGFFSLESFVYHRQDHRPSTSFSQRLWNGDPKHLTHNSNLVLPTSSRRLPYEWVWGGGKTAKWLCEVVWGWAETTKTHNWTFMPLEHFSKLFLTFISKKSPVNALAGPSQSSSNLYYLPFQHTIHAKRDRSRNVKYLVCSDLTELAWIFQPHWISP